MALNISSSQIYAGRYHYKRPEIPNLLDTQKYTASTPGKSVKEATGVDTVTISDEGLAKAKDWREYTKDNENISHTGVNPKEELYKELNTVNNIDTASMFNCELGEVADQIQKENGLGDHSRSQEEFLTVMAKAYQVIYDRIDEEFFRCIPAAHNHKSKPHIPHVCRDHFASAPEYSVRSEYCLCLSVKSSVCLL